MNTIKAFWHACDNFGDALTPYLIEKISGKKAEFVCANSNPSLVMVTGSILGCSINQGIIWGNGCAFQSDIDPNCFTGPSEDFIIIATRGILSKKLVEACGHQPQTIGDPGILLPRFYQPNVSKKYNLGIVCSWVDYDYVSLKYKDEKILVINTMGNIEDIINKMSECDVILSGALHGLVAAVAYGIPTAWVKFSDKVIGDGFKFHDFSSCLETPFDINNLEDTSLEIKDLINLASIHKLTISADELLDRCPFKKKDTSNDSGL